jgi:hypothetical protein
MCTHKAGSREHIFPAALGGRRVNKGIYCGTHNQALGPLAAVLSQQVEAINAWIGVRSDHSDQPHQFAITNPADGHQYLVSATETKLAAPKITSDTVIDGVRRIQVEVANQQQMQEWIAEQRGSGLKVDVQGSVQRGRSFLTRPVAVQLKLGGIQGLRAVGYIALTYLAHYFPDIARQHELGPFKDSVQGSDPQQRAWWDFATLPTDIGPNPFRFGHMVLIGISAARQEAYARVSLFSTLDFAIHFGKVRCNSDRTVIAYIDPQADRPPGDICEIKRDGSLAPVNAPSSYTSSLYETIVSGDGQQRFARLWERIQDWQMECIAKGLLPKIEATGALDPSQRLQTVKLLLGEHKQCVFNLMQFIANGLKQQFESDPHIAQMAPIFDLFVVEDPNSTTGISLEAECVVELATMELANQVSNDYAEGKLDWQRLSLLLSGGPGAVIVAKVILRPITAKLGIDPAQLAV